MKYFACLGNPPYQSENNNQRLYPAMYTTAKTIADNVEMIFPTAWQDAKNTNGLGLMNNEETKRDEEIVFIKNKHNAFPGVPGAEWTNVIMWKEGYDNGLDGKQRVIDDNGNIDICFLPIDRKEIAKPEQIASIVKKVNTLGEAKIMPMVSARKPYGFEADPLDNPDKYGIVLHDKPFEGSVRLFGKMKGEGRTSRYISRNSLPKVSSLLDKYKIFVVKAWGNMDEKGGYLGGSYSKVFAGKPGDCCSEMYIEIGPFSNKAEADNAVKYMNTKFFRAVFYNNKFSQNTARETYRDVPLQDFTADSDIDWSQSVADIDKQLYKKYGLSDDEIEFIESHVKEME